MDRLYPFWEISSTRYQVLSLFFISFYNLNIFVSSAHLSLQKRLHSLPTNVILSLLVVARQTSVWSFKMFNFQIPFHTLHTHSCWIQSVRLAPPTWPRFRAAPSPMQQTNTDPIPSLEVREPINFICSTSFKRSEWPQSNSSTLRE